jgi:UBX domain-containing protein 7
VASNFFDGEEEVRAPIPKKQEILLPPEEGIHGMHYRLRQNYRQTINPFRNFAYESQSDDFDSKRSRLEDLFRPPIDLICPGSFNVVKEYTRSKNKWLLINVQDDSEFTSQILYRDIW